MQLEIQFRALGAQSFNGIPVISNREYKGNITLKDEEPAVIAGALSRTEQLSMTGIPGFGYVPGLNHVMTSNTKQVDDDELLIVITPHITSQPTGQTTEVWLAK
jgi:general secretion pathway protein D